ncbi:MAG TPA: hypothetical protein VNE38_19035 [Ktedonobacteraceae bacterium]|nr:hypothetical protein [Ktedonobacteraceae bacterium]
MLVDAIDRAFTKAINDLATFLKRSGGIESLLVSATDRILPVQDAVYRVSQSRTR